MTEQRWSTLAYIFHRVILRGDSCAYPFTNDPFSPCCSSRRVFPLLPFSLFPSCIPYFPTFPHIFFLPSLTSSSLPHGTLVSSFIGLFLASSFSLSFDACFLCWHNPSSPSSLHRRLGTSFLVSFLPASMPLSLSKCSFCSSPSPFPLLLSLPLPLVFPLIPSSF